MAPGLDRIGHLAGKAEQGTRQNRHPMCLLLPGPAGELALTRAIALEPAFILADEIVSGPDVSSQVQVLNLLEDLVRDLEIGRAHV